MTKNVKVSELDSVVKEAADILLDYTIGFAYPQENKSLKVTPPLTLGFGGTGILVSANGRRGILTADHVLQNFQKGVPVGLVYMDRRGFIPHRFILDMNFVQRITVARGPVEAQGPDLALIGLSTKDADDIDVKKSFYNLSKRKSKALAMPPADKISPWIMQGFVDELTEHTSSSSGVLENWKFKALCGLARVVQSRQDTKYDYLSLEVNCGVQHSLPGSFGGSSGGGVWHLVLRETPDGIGLDDVLLGGIAFYQSAPINDRRLIECHSWKSIYEFAERALAEL